MRSRSSAVTAAFRSALANADVNSRVVLERVDASITSFRRSGAPPAIATDAATKVTPTSAFSRTALPIAAQPASPATWRASR